MLFVKRKYFYWKFVLSVFKKYIKLKCLLKKKNIYRNGF